ncbi:MAG: M28 family peptidase [Candidatus Odinarchaeota archaeon]
MILKANMTAEELNSQKLDKSSLEDHFNVDNAYRITERLAFPRLIGSKGEKKAIDIIVDEFKSAGYYQIYQDKFKTSFYNWLFIRFIFIAIGSALILLALSVYISPFLTLGLLIFDIYITFRALSYSVSNKIKLCKNEKFNFETENIYVDLKNKNSKVKVVFMGHWDSKSQKFPSSTRITIFLISIFGGMLLFLSYFIISILKILINLNIPLLNNILLDLSILIAIIGSFNYFNKTDNNSSGAFDNAGAVGVLIELARFYKKNPISNIDFIFLSPGSEELNLGGAIHFIQKYKKEFDKDSTFFINLDLIGGSNLIRLTTSYGIPRKPSSLKLNRLFFESAIQNKIKIKDIYSPTGVWSDYMPIVQEGFEACWLGSEPGIKKVHTKNDNMNLVSKQGLRNILLLCIDVVNKLNDELK